MPPETPTPPDPHDFRWGTPVPAPKKPWRFSYSQLSTFKDCQAKFAFVYVEGHRGPQTEAAAFGTRAHEVAQAALRGTPIPGQSGEGKAAASLVAMTPRPWDSLQIELEEDWQEEMPDGHGPAIFLAKPDLFRAPLFAGGAPWIGDYKTTGRIGPYTMTPEKLTTDIQAILYSRWALHRFPESKSVELLWMTTERNGKRTRVTPGAVSKQWVAEEFQKLRLAAVDARGILRSGVLGNDAPKNRDACDAYGGCPHRASGRCEGSSMFSGGPLSMAMQSPPGVNTALNFLQGAPQSAPPAPPAWGQPGSRGVDGYPFPPGTWVRRVDTGHSGKVDERGILWVNVAPPGQVAGYAAQPPGGESAYEVVPAPAYAAPQAPQINAPEGTPNTTLAQSAATFVQVHREEKLEPSTVGMNAAAAQAVNAALVATAPQAAAPPAAAEAEKPKKGGRPKKETPAAAVAAAGDAGPPERLVFVDCGPTGVECQTFGEIFELARAAIQTETQIAHPAGFEFGKGAGVLYAKLAAGSYGSWVSVRSSAYGAEMFVQLLESRGYVVVR